MNSAQILTRSFAFAIAIGMPCTHALSQQLLPIAGTYSVVSIAAFGANPLGQMILSNDGRYSIILTRSALPKIAAGARDKGTPEEDKTIVGGSIGHFGKYTVDAQQTTITFDIEASTFPNWNGTTSKRPLKVSGDLLSITNSTPSTGGPASETVWKRVK